MQGSRAPSLACGGLSECKVHENVVKIRKKSLVYRAQQMIVPFRSVLLSTVFRAVCLPVQAATLVACHEAPPRSVARNDRSLPTLVTPTATSRPSANSIEPVARPIAEYRIAEYRIAEYRIGRRETVTLPDGAQFTFLAHGHKDVGPNQQSPLIVHFSMRASEAGLPEDSQVSVMPESSRKFSIGPRSFELVEYIYNENMTIRYLGTASPTSAH
jgi:hypothetical protein